MEIFGQRGGVAPPKLELEFSRQHVGHGNGSCDVRGAYFCCRTAWACDGHVINRVGVTGAIEMLEERFEDRANMALFIASVALELYMLWCRVHAVVAVPPKLIVRQETVNASA